MLKTIWTGGKFGTENMPEATVSLYYSEIYKETPKVMIEDNISNPLTPVNTGFYDGTIPNVTDYVHQTKMGFLHSETNSNLNMVCTINGTVVPVVNVSPSTGKFKVTSTLSGYMKVTYLPYSEGLYFSKVNPANYSTPMRVRGSIIRKEHIGEILNALNGICNELQIPTRNYSIEPFTGNPIAYNHADGVSTNTPLTVQLFQEITDHINYLSNYVATIESTFIRLDDLGAYPYDTINTERIELFRFNINEIEAGINL
jgi:hypothetical protein